MRKLFFLLTLAVFLYTSGSAQNTEIHYLSGTGSDNTVKWDFFCTEGQNSGKWTKIDVPSNWELQGFGNFRYGHDKVADEVGLYKYEFKIPAGFKNKRVFIVFDGSMTDTEVKINGKLAGPVHQGSFYRFRYDITSLLKAGAKNLLEVKVSKESAEQTVNRAERRADYWVFGGIFRPVWLEVVPKDFIDHVAIDAKADGNIKMVVHLSSSLNNCVVEGQVETITGEPYGKVFYEKVVPGQNVISLNAHLENPELWSPEFPNLYRVSVSLKDDSGVKHKIVRKFGFRTIEVKLNDGIYVNDTKIMFRGVCRHSFWPTTGRCTNKTLSITDVNLMKDMNMNAVRMSHYPPDEHFLDACDSLGLFVIDELAGWQGYYGTEPGKKLIKEMVERDVNHPSIVLWANGNESGFNPELRKEYEKYDPQKRHVIEPQSLYNGTNTNHYMPYNYGINQFFNGRDIFFPTEFLHGLYDGGHGAALDDVWNLMLSNPLSAGGFLWVFADEGVVRNDLNDSIDTYGNKAPDGIVGPFREKEGSFFTVKEIWSPVFFPRKIINDNFDGRLSIENRFLYTNLNQCKFSFELAKLSGSIPFKETSRSSFAIESPWIEPGGKGHLQMKLPENWNEYDVLYITAVDPHERNINTWSWNISSPEKIADKLLKFGSEEVKAAESDEYLVVTTGNTAVTFSRKTGLLVEVKIADQIVPFNNGPVFVGFTSVFRELKHYTSEGNYVVESIYDNSTACHTKWTIHKGGWIELEYDYRPDRFIDLSGISFSFPEEGVIGASLMANGPYRVWKNRLKGTQFGIYEKQYNNTVTGETWIYPEFKGYYSNFYAVQIRTQSLPITIVSSTQDLYLHLFTPQIPQFPSGSVTPPFPSGNISILNAISPIGTKFRAPENLGPQGLKNEYLKNNSSTPLSGRIFIKFGNE